ncbi:hypothetical protein C8A05DRAFT_12054 [Staphylotrichum tortipilum]|uniref:Duf1665 domain containing protein n=1 Tax=Staphylotrichum tortipilum TaxID=2831512 RepID=A0AAN6MS81_9PEZI|nr:hypothetical protein C8A05DRAFT_12054 [Staphylotrichum longicolle]
MSATSPATSPASTASSTSGPEYPGWGLELRWPEWYNDDQQFIYPIGVSNESEESVVKKISVREAAMMMAMEELTDKPDWHIKVFDDEIASRWHREFTTSDDRVLWERLDGHKRDPCPADILDATSADHCIAELRHKAKYFEKSGIICTLNHDFAIAKSDTIVPGELATGLRDAFARLVASEPRPDWHPWTNETVRDLVHPSMYPLVYGRSLCLPDEVVGVDDAIDKWAGKGEVIPRRPEWGDEPQGKALRRRRIEEIYWSTMYQWLPANVSFTPEGGVRFTSYVNNLHPTKHRDVYTVLEKLIEIAVPMWDHCLSRYSRVGHESGPWLPSDRVTMPSVDHVGENEDSWHPKSAGDMRQMEAKAAAEMEAEEATKAAGLAEMAAQGEDKPNSTEGESIEWASEGSETETEAGERWKETRRAVLPPAKVFSSANYCADEGSTLRALFHDRGLQVIVKLASIELTPDKPRFDGGNWHVEGQMNERIVGTCLYYLDSENITETSLAFRASTREDENEHALAWEDDTSWMEQAYGVRLRGGSRVQHYGTVKTPQGRLLAFPNVFHHRVSPFELADPAKPGHRRFVALWLVDPYTRIISTANVPPQQAEWYAERAFGESAAAANDLVARLPSELVQMIAERGIGPAELAGALAEGKAGEAKLPPELLGMVRRALGEWRLMTREEAQRHRENLMDERSKFVQESNDTWNWSMTYSFCEH